MQTSLALLIEIHSPLPLQLALLSVFLDVLQSLPTCLPDCMLPKSSPSSIRLLKCSFQPIGLPELLDVRKVTYIFIHMTLNQGTDIATPLVEMVEYFNTSCSSLSPQDPSFSFFFGMGCNIVLKLSADNPPPYGSLSWLFPP